MIKYLAILLLLSGCHKAPHGSSDLANNAADACKNTPESLDRKEECMFEYLHTQCAIHNYDFKVCGLLEVEADD